MLKRDGKSTLKIIFGEYFVEKLLVNPNYVFSKSEIEGKAIEFGLSTKQIVDKVKRDFINALFYIGDETYILNPDYKLSDFIDEVNIQRRSVGLRSLEIPNPTQKERI